MKRARGHCPLARVHFCILPINTFIDYNKFKSVTQRLDIRMTSQLTPHHYTTSELLDNSEGRILVVIGTCEQYGTEELHAWAAYADNLQKAAPDVLCVEVTTEGQVETEEDVSIQLLHDFVEKSSTGRFRIFLIFSKNPILPSLIKQFVKDCYIHEVRFLPDNLTRMFCPKEAPLPQADSYEDLILGNYNPSDVDKVCVSANFRRLDEVASNLYFSIDTNDRTKLIHAYQELSSLLSEEDFSLKPWQDSKYLPEMLDAWTKVKDARKAAWRAFGGESEIILQYLEIADQSAQVLQNMREAIEQVSMEKARFNSPEADKKKTKADWEYRHKTAEVVVDKAANFARNVSIRLEQEESSVGISMVSTSTTDSWMKCLSDVTDEISRLASSQIQKVKAMVSSYTRLLSADKAILDRRL